MRHSSWKLCVPWHKIACVFGTVRIWYKGSLRIFQVTKVNNVNGTNISTRNYSLDMCNSTFCKARVSQLTPLKNGCAFTCWKVEGSNESHSSINLSRYLCGTNNRLSFHNPTLRIFSTINARRIPLKILLHQSADLDHEQGTYKYEDDALMMLFNRNLYCHIGKTKHRRKRHSIKDYMTTLHISSKANKMIHSILTLSAVIRGTVTV